MSIQSKSERRRRDLARALSSPRPAMPNPMSPGFARFCQARNEIAAAEDLDELLESYLFHRIRHEMEEEGAFSVNFDTLAVEKAKEMGVMPIRTYGMSDAEYDKLILKELIGSGKHNRFYTVVDGEIVGPVRGYPTALEATQALKGTQMDLFGGGRQVFSARGLVARQLRVEDEA